MERQGYPRESRGTLGLSGGQGGSLGDQRCSGKVGCVPRGQGGVRGFQGSQGVKGDVRGIQGDQGGVEVSQGVKRGVRGVPRVKGGGIQVSQGVMRGFRGKGKSGGSKGLKGTLWVYQGSRERHSDMIHFKK